MSTPRGIKPSDRETYLVEVYFMPRRDGYLAASVDRAYRDAQRAAHGVSDIAQHPKRTTIPKLVVRLMNGARRARTQAQFDAWHKRVTYRIKAEFRAIGYQRFT